MFTNKSRMIRRLQEEKLYEEVHSELLRGDIRAGLWAKALSDAEYSEDKAKGLYMKYRVQSILDEINLTETMLKDMKEKTHQKEQARKTTKEGLARNALNDLKSGW